MRSCTFFAQRQYSPQTFHLSACALTVGPTRAPLESQNSLAVVASGCADIILEAVRFDFRTNNVPVETFGIVPSGAPLTGPNFRFEAHRTTSDVPTITLRSLSRNTEGSGVMTIRGGDSLWKNKGDKCVADVTVFYSTLAERSAPTNTIEVTFEVGHQSLEQSPGRVMQRINKVDGGAGVVLSQSFASLHL